MRATFTVLGRFPSLNDYVNDERSNRFAGGKVKKQQTQRVQHAARNMPRFRKPVFVTFRWVEGSTRRDWDNVAFAKKFVLDGLVKAGVIGNDSQRFVVGFRDEFEVDPKHPRVIVTVSDELV